jgi:hypothetical protein
MQKDDLIIRFEDNVPFADYIEEIKKIIDPFNYSRFNVRNQENIIRVIELLRYIETEFTENIKERELTGYNQNFIKHDNAILMIYSEALDNIEKFEGKYYLSVLDNLTVCLRLLPYFLGMIGDNNWLFDLPKNLLTRIKDEQFSTENNSC